MEQDASLARDEAAQLQLTDLQADDSEEIENLKRQILQAQDYLLDQRKRRRGVFQELYNLTSIQELAAFDSLIFLAEQRKVKKDVVYDFLKKCFYLLEPHTKNERMFCQHLTELNRMLGENIYSIQSTHRADFKADVTVFLPYINECRKLLEEIYQENAGNYTKRAKREISIPRDNFSAPSSQFYKCVDNYLKPGKGAATDELAEQRILFGDVMNLLGQIDNLQKRKRATTKITQSKFSSPYMSAVRRQQQLYTSTKGKFARILTSNLDSMIHQESDRLHSLFSIADNVREETSRYQREISKRIEGAKHQTQKYKQQYQAGIDVLSNYDIVPTEEIIDPSLMDELFNLCSESNDQALLDKLDELVGCVTETQELISQYHTEFQKDVFTTKALLKLLSGFEMKKERNRLYSRTTQLIQELDQLYEEIRPIMTNNSLTNWTTRVKSELRNVESVCQKQDSLFEKQIEDFEINEPTDFETIQQDSFACISKMPEIGNQVKELRLEWFKTTQMLNALKSRQKQSRETRDNKALLQKINEALFCPICQTERRDRILLKCHHAFCLNCLEGKSRCPLCDSKIGEGDIVQYYVQN